MFQCARYNDLFALLLFLCENYCNKMQIYHDLATSVWAVITWRALLQIRRYAKT